jgi:hypothetical protein
LRFTLRRPGNPVASACIHGTPCRDVASRVHVSVAGVVAGSAPEAGLALARLRVHAPARRAALASVRGFNLLDAARGLVVQPPHQQSPPGGEDSPGSGRLWPFTFRPGSATVPRTLRVIFVIFRSSTRITSNPDARPVETFSHPRGAAPGSVAGQRGGRTDRPVACRPAGAGPAQFHRARYRPEPGRAKRGPGECASALLTREHAALAPASRLAGLPRVLHRLGRQHRRPDRGDSQWDRDLRAFPARASRPGS